MIGPGFAAAVGARLLLPILIALVVIGAVLFGAGLIIGRIM